MTSKGNILKVCITALIGKASFWDVSTFAVLCAFTDCVLARPKGDLMEFMFYIPETASIIGVVAILLFSSIIGGFFIPLVMKNASETGKDADWKKHYIADPILAAAVGPFLSILLLGLVCSYWFPGLGAMTYYCLLFLLNLVFIRWCLIAFNKGVDAVIEQIGKDASSAKKLVDTAKQAEETIRIDGKN